MVLVLATILALALMGGALIVGARLLSTQPPDLGPLAVAMPPTACPAGTVLKSGDIATIAGTGEPLSDGDGGPATAAALAEPTGIAVDASGAIYVADLNTTIRRVGIDGKIATYAGKVLADRSRCRRVWRWAPSATVWPRLRREQDLQGRLERRHRVHRWHRQPLRSCSGLRSSW